MRNRVFTLMGSLRSRSILPSAAPLPRFDNCALSSIEKKRSCRLSTQLSGATEKKIIPGTIVFPPFPETEDQIQRRKLLEVNAEQLNRPAFDLGAEFTHPNKEVMHILSDFVEKNRNSPTYLCHLRKLLTSARLRELGVGYNEIPIPDKQEWKASWHEEGKPKWLGTISTHADGRLQYTASVAGYVEKDGGKGGYGVIVFDYYGRPKVASVGVSLRGNLPLIYYEFQGVRSALQLALDHGFGAGMKLYCNSDTVSKIIDLCFEPTSITRCRMGRSARWDTSKLCRSCVGLRLFAYEGMDDFDLLFPVIKDILDLLCKINRYLVRDVIEVTTCCGSGHFAKYFSTSTTEEDLNRSGLLVDDLLLYEMVLKPDKFPEEVDDSIYDEVFKGDRVHSDRIMVEKVSETNEHTHPDALIGKLRKFCTHKYFPGLE